MKATSTAFRFSAAFFWFTLPVFSQAQQTLQYNKEYQCGGDKVIVAYCRRDSDQPGTRTPDAANFCAVHYPGKKTPSGYPVQTVELRLDVENKLRGCGALAPAATGGGMNTGRVPNAADATATRGFLLIQERKYNEAMVELKEAIRLDPRHALAFAYVGQAQYYLKEYVVANAAFERALQLNVPNPHVSYSWIGDCQKELGQYDKALSAYRESIRLKPDYVRAFNSAGLAFYLKKDYPNAAIFFEQAARLDPRTAIYRKNIGMAHIGAGRKDEAMKVYNSLVPIDPKLANELLDEITKPATTASTTPRTPAEQRLDEGHKFYTAKDYPKALASYQEALRLKPDYGEAAHYLGMTYYQLKQYQKAISEFESAITLKFASPYHSREWIGDAHSELKEDAKALAAYTESLRLKPDYAQVARKAGDALYRLKRVPEAITAYQNALKLGPNDAATHIALGDVYYLQKDYEKAVPFYKDAVRLAPKNHDALNVLGTTYYLLKRFADALPVVEEAVKLQPDSAVYLGNLGDTYSKLGRKTEALAIHQKLVPLDPTRAKNLYARITETPEMAATREAVDRLLAEGGKHYDTREFAKAIAEYEKIIPLKPSNSSLAIAHWFIGVCYLDLRVYDKAFTHLNESKRFDPKYAPLYSDLGLAFERTLQFPDALAAYQNAVRLNTEPALVAGQQRSLGRMYALMGRRSDAMQIYGDLQKSDPAKAKYLLADVEELDKGGPAAILVSQALGWFGEEGPESLEIYRNALKLKPSNIKVLFDIGLGLSLSGASDAEVLAVYRHIISLKPKTEDLAEAYHQIGETLNFMKEYAKAIPEIKQAQRLKPSAEFSHELGRSYTGLKQYPDALAAYLEAERLGSMTASTTVAVADTYVAMGQTDKAVAHLEAAARTDTAPVVYAKLAEIYISLKRPSDAVSVLTKAIQLSPKFNDGHYLLGIAYVAMGRKTEAMQSYRTLRPLNNELAQKLLAEINKP